MTTGADSGAWQAFLQQVEAGIAELEDCLSTGRAPRLDPVPLPQTAPPEHLRTRALALVERLAAGGALLELRRDGVLAQLRSLPSARPRTTDRSADLGHRVDLSA